MTRLIRALNKRRALLMDSDKGFTLIELLVVVIIIGILAAIAIPIYLGVQNNAKDSTAQSDLTNAKIAIVAFQAQDPNGAYPPALTAAALSQYGYSGTSNISWDTVTAGTAPANNAAGFCVKVISASTKIFYTTDSTGTSAANTKPATGTVCG